MSNSARTTSEFSDLSAHDRQLSYELFIAADDDGTDDFGFSGDVHVHKGACLICRRLDKCRKLAVVSDICRKSSY